ncbi:MAG: 30S ribosomal protein S17 [Parcubacteria group bacterium]
MSLRTEKKIIRTLSGVVVSDKMQKTIVVKVSRSVVHPRYHKRFQRSRKFKVHDPENRFHTGDTVTFRPTRPLSREKCWIAEYPAK